MATVTAQNSVGSAPVQTGDFGLSADQIRQVQALSGNIMPDLDPRYLLLQKQQIENQKKFRSGIPQQAESLQLGAQERGRQDIARAMGGVDQGFNRRGLLYGGNRLASRSQAGNEIASNLANQRAGTNRELRDVADAMTRQAIESGFGMAGVGSERFSSQQSSQQAMQDLQSRRNERERDAYNQAGKAIGQGAGQLIYNYQNPRQQ